MPVGSPSATAGCVHKRIPSPPKNIRIFPAGLILTFSGRKATTSASGQVQKPPLIRPNLFAGRKSFPDGFFPGKDTLFPHITAQIRDSFHKLWDEWHARNCSSRVATIIRNGCFKASCGSSSPVEFLPLSDQTGKGISVHLRSYPNRLAWSKSSLFSIFPSFFSRWSLHWLYSTGTPVARPISMASSGKENPIPSFLIWTA